MQLLDDQEHDLVRPLADYLTEYPGIAEFVQAEHEHLVAASRPSAEPAAFEFTPGRRIGRYELVRVIGEGGMGRAFLAKDPQLSREVVLKALRIDEGPSDPSRERLRREARVLGRLNHPHLAEVLDVLEVDEGVFLVMPFYDGRPLSACLAEARAASERPGAQRMVWPRLSAAAPGEREQALRAVIGFFAQAASALHTAHTAKIVHRDLKPQNVLVRPDGSPLVLDFGLALPGGDDRLTMPGEVLGTPSYMAPEQIDGRAVDARADVYALGVMLYEALTLVQPFAGPGGREATFHRVLRGDAIPLRRHQPLVPRDLEAVVTKAMERDPARRYADAESFGLELRRVLALEPTEARPVSGLMRWARRIARRRMAVALGLLVSTSIVFGIYAYDAKAQRRQSFADLEAQFVRATRALDDTSRPGEPIDGEVALQACNFVRKLSQEREVVSLAQWEAWCDELQRRFLRDSARTFATCLLEARGERAVLESPREVRDVVREFEALVRGWPSDPEHAPRRTWAAVTAAHWALGNGRDPAAAKRIADAALERIQDQVEWPIERVEQVLDVDEFWITEKKRPVAGTIADARAELRLLQGQAAWELGAGTAGLDAAVEGLRSVANAHRLANALACRSEARRRLGDLEGALEDATEARALYGSGFQNLSVESPPLSRDQNGVDSMDLVLARIHVDAHDRAPSAESKGRLVESLGHVRRVLERQDTPAARAPVLRAAPLVGAEVWLAMKEEGRAPDDLVRQLRDAKLYFESKGWADDARRAGALLEGMRQ